MGNAGSRFTDTEISKCVDSIEEELLTGGYEDGVTPESVVMCLRTMLMAARKNGGNVVVPKAVGVTYERDVVISCFPRPKSRYSGTSITVSSRGYSMPNRKATPPSYTHSVVESTRSSSMTASEARKIRMQARSEESRRRATPSRRQSVDVPHTDEDVSGGRVARSNSVASIEDAMEQFAGLNIRRAPEPVSLATPPRNDPPVFRGPPTQRGVGSVRDRARVMEGRI